MLRIGLSNCEPLGFTSNPYDIYESICHGPESKWFRRERKVFVFPFSTNSEIKYLDLFNLCFIKFTGYSPLYTAGIFREGDFLTFRYIFTTKGDRSVQTIIYGEEFRRIHCPKEISSKVAQKVLKRFTRNLLW